MMISGIGICNSNFVNSKNNVKQKSSPVVMSKTGASDTFSFKGSKEFASVKIAPEIEDFVAQALSDHWDSGARNLDVVMESENPSAISQACENLVKGWHVHLIQDFMEMRRPEGLSQRDASIIFNLTAELKKLNKTNNAVSVFVNSSILNGASVPDNIKQIVRQVFK